MNNFLATATIQQGDLVGFTFFIGTMAMLAATVFFFVGRGSVSGKWKLSLTVSGLITGIAAVHYYYMRGWAATGQSPTEFRYIDWILTVPLMCVEFYLLTRPFGAKGGTLFKLILASIFMLVTGYIGEIAGPRSIHYVGNCLYCWLPLHRLEVFAGDVAKLTKLQTVILSRSAMFLMKIFITAGWAIYPIGYMTMEGNLLHGMGWSLDVLYNIADAINKIGFGLVVYSVAKSESEAGGAKIEKLA